MAKLKTKTVQQMLKESNPKRKPGKNLLSSKADKAGFEVYRKLKLLKKSLE